MLARNMRYRVLSYIQSDAYHHNLDADTSLGQYDDGVTRSVVTDVNFEGSITVQSLSDVKDEFSGRTLQQLVDTWTHTFVGETKLDVKNDQLLTSTLCGFAIPTVLKKKFISLNGPGTLDTKSHVPIRSRL